MKKLTEIRTTIRPFLIALPALVWLWLPLRIQAVVPPPDGGYPGFNTAEGVNALFSLTSGTFNTGLGAYSLYNDNIGSNNTGVGINALRFNTNGSNNTAVGVQALYSNSMGNWNTATGSGALYRNTLGTHNTAIGFEALRNNIYGFQSTALGFRALYNSTNITGPPHGFGTQNTAVGFQALYGLVDGSNNIAVGVNAGYNISLGQSNNIDIGNVGGFQDFGTTRIGSIGSQTRAFIAGIRGVTTENADAIPVLVDSAGQFGTLSSSRRFKCDIKPIDDASEAILALKPVTFHYKDDKTNTSQFGLIAAEVADVNPDLVVRDDNGRVYTVRYEAVNAMLLNEFLKEHKKVEEQQSKIDRQDATVAQLQSTMTQQQRDFEIKFAEQKQQINALASGLQKVSAQIEASRLTQQTVVDNP